MCRQELPPGCRPKLKDGVADMFPCSVNFVMTCSLQVTGPRPLTLSLEIQTLVIFSQKHSTVENREGWTGFAGKLTRWSSSPSSQHRAELGSALWGSLTSWPSYVCECRPVWGEICIRSNTSALNKMSTIWQVLAGTATKSCFNNLLHKCIPPTTVYKSNYVTHTDSPLSETETSNILLHYLQTDQQMLMKKHTKACPIPLKCKLSEKRFVEGLERRGVLLRSH